MLPLLGLFQLALFFLAVQRSPSRVGPERLFVLPPLPLGQLGFRELLVSSRYAGGRRRRLREVDHIVGVLAPQVQVQVVRGVGATHSRVGRVGRVVEQRYLIPLLVSQPLFALFTLLRGTARGGGGGGWDSGLLGRGLGEFVLGVSTLLLRFFGSFRLTLLGTPNAGVCGCVETSKSRCQRIAAV